MDDKLLFIIYLHVDHLFLPMFLEYKLSTKKKNAGAFFIELVSLCKIKTQNRKVCFSLVKKCFKKTVGMCDY